MSRARLAGDGALRNWRLFGGVFPLYLLCRNA
jgi:hypothetical protein